MTNFIDVSWPRFVRLMLVPIGITTFIILSSQSGLFDPPNMSLALMMTSLLLFFGYRWHSIRSKLANGQLTEAGLLATPVKVVLGPLRHALLWFCVTLALTFLPIVVWVLSR